MITKTKIIAVLQQHKDTLTAIYASDDGTFDDLCKKIADDIAGGIPEITPSKWLHFEQSGTSESGKTSIYAVRQKEDPQATLGEIRWEGRYRSYAFFPSNNCVFDCTCMGDIINFIEVLMHLRKSRKETTV